MQKYEVIENAILKRDIKSLRENVGNICYIDRSFSSNEFDEIIKYIISNGINIKEDTLIGKRVSDGKDSFDDDDFTRAVFELKKNFCNERINEVKKIGKALCKKNIKDEEVDIDNTITFKHKKNNQNEQKSIKNIAVPVAIAISIAAIATIVYFIKK